MKIIFDDTLPAAACLRSDVPLIASLLAPSLLRISGLIPQGHQPDIQWLNVRLVA
jgi:hypothetical protein